MAYILIVILQGWGSGVGSTGNALAMQEFSSKQNCQIAADAIENALPRRPDYPKPICVPK